MTAAAGTAGARPGGFRAMRDRVSALAAAHRSITIIIGWIIIASALPMLMLVPPFSTFQAQSLWIDGFTNAGVFILLALGLNMVVGFAGLLDLGYAAFYAIGAYTYAFAASPTVPWISLHVPFWPMLLVGAAVAAFGILLGAPTLRLRGDYLAIVTLGFGEIVPAVFLNADKITNGTNGIGGVYKPELLGYQFTLGNPVPYYVAMVAIIAVVMIFVYRLQDSRLGRAWMAVREDELAAASNGVNTVTTKLLAFALGASTAGLAGVFTASKLTLVSPDQFSFAVSFTILAMVVLGGMGNVWGVAMGAFILYTIQSVVLKQLNPFFHTLNVPFLKDIDFVQYQFLLYGVALVGMMLLRPEGLFPSSRRKRELHTELDDGVGDELGPDPSSSPMEGA
jgi:ABC-type branched-subunit amino acid transport system permease subunit